MTCESDGSAALYRVNLVQGSMPIQFTGHAKCSITCPSITEDDLDVINSRATQFNMSHRLISETLRTAQMGEFMWVAQGAWAPEDDSEFELDPGSCTLHSPTHSGWTLDGLHLSYN